MTKTKKENALYFLPLYRNEAKISNTQALPYCTGDVIRICALAITQDNLAQEEGNMGVISTRERYTIGHRWDSLRRRSKDTWPRGKTGEEKGNRHKISKQEGKH